VTERATLTCVTLPHASKLNVLLVRLYKYRDLSSDEPKALDLLESVLRNQAFWAARPDTLNDPLEFVWSCVWEATPDTAGLLATVLTRYRRLEAASALRYASDAISAGRLEAVGAPVVESVVANLRAEVGLVCFGRSPDNATLWSRYAGDGEGVVIELEADDSLRGTQLRDVKYVSDKRVHVDEFLRASLEQYSTAPLFEAVLLAKPVSWASEDEVRFISKKHSLLVRLKPSRIRSLLLGPRLSSGAVERIRAITMRLPYALPLHSVGA
jgi:hypothetical protein